MDKVKSMIEKMAVALRLPGVMTFAATPLIF
jgi:hypothetical protein